MDVRDKLLFEPVYAGDIKGNVAPKASLRIPWTWLPAALSLLQEVKVFSIMSSSMFTCLMGLLQLVKFAVV